MLGSGVLTFLAGAEIDPASLRANLRAGLAIGTAAFLLSFAGVWLVTPFYFIRAGSFAEPPARGWRWASS